MTRADQICPESKELRPKWARWEDWTCPGCKELKGKYVDKFFIGSLQSEILGTPKWFLLCDGCERKLAEKNGRIIAKAEELGMSVADYVRMQSLGLELEA